METTYHIQNMQYMAILDKVEFDVPDGQILIKRQNLSDTSSFFSEFITSSTRNSPYICRDDIITTFHNYCIVRGVISRRLGDPRGNIWLNIDKKDNLSKI